MFRTERFHRLSKEGFWIILGQAAAVVGAVVGVRLLTELLDPSAYGELALGMTVASLVSQTVFGPLSNGIARFYAQAVEQSDLGSYQNAVRRMVLLATGIIILIGVLMVAGLFISGQKEWVAIIVAVFIFAIFSSYNSILNGIQNAARQRSIVALHQGLESWARFLIAAGMMVLLGTTSTVAMIGYAIAVFLIIGSQSIFLRKILPRNLSSSDSGKNWQQQIWKYSWPFNTWVVFYCIQSASDRWALGILATTQEVGLYAVLFQLGNYPMSILTKMAMQFLAPIFYQLAGDASDNRRNARVNTISWRLTALVLIMSCVLSFIVFLFHGQIFHIFVASEYGSVSHFLPWMILSGGIFAAGQTVALDLMSRMKTRAMIKAKIVTALLGVTLNFAGAYWFGIAGIVVASVLFSFLYFIWLAMLSVETMKTRHSIIGTGNAD